MVASRQSTSVECCLLIGCRASAFSCVDRSDDAPLSVNTHYKDIEIYLCLQLADSMKNIYS